MHYMCPQDGAIVPANIHLPDELNKQDQTIKYKTMINERQVSTPGVAVLRLLCLLLLHTE